MTGSGKAELTRDEKMTAAIRFFQSRTAGEPREDERVRAEHLREMAEGIQECLRALAVMKTEVHHIEHALSVH
jgi:hypothetical protein